MIRHNLANGGDVVRSAAVVASWTRYAEGVDEDGAPIEVVDRLKDLLMRIAQTSSDPLAFLRDRELFADLVDDERFTDAHLACLDSLSTRGARKTLQDLMTAHPR